MSARLRAAWAGARSWWEYHVGPLPGCLRTSECYRVPRWWFRVRDGLDYLRWVTISAVLNRWAPAELRHAALLLGYDGMGYGRVDVLLSHLSEFAVGENLASRVRYGEEWPELDSGRAAEMFRLERSLFGVIPGLVSR